MYQHFSESLQKILTAELPGTAIQYEMAHAVRVPQQSVPENARNAGVMALFYPKASDLHLALIERTSKHPNDAHGGQVSFPGGKEEQEDVDMRATAIRETEEEIGVKGSDIEILGALSKLYIPVSNFHVHPYVGVLPYEARFIPQPSEVQQVLEVPVSDLFNPELRRVTDLKIGTRMTLNQVPYFHFAEKVVWGATAMMLNELIYIIRESGLNQDLV